MEEIVKISLTLGVAVLIFWSSFFIVSTAEALATQGYVPKTIQVYLGLSLGGLFIVGFALFSI